MEALNGLTDWEARNLQLQYGKNMLGRDRTSFFRIVFKIVLEPMFVMLAIACAAYFILGENTEGSMMLAAMTFVTAISLFQEARSAKAMHLLQELTAAQVTVVRQGAEISIDAEDLVPGDVMLLEEGEKVPADAVLLKANDFSVDESVITGESLPVAKSSSPETLIYQGSVVNSGSCYARVSAIGANTELGKIGTSVTRIGVSRTPLQNQVNRLVHALALFGFLGFGIIFLLHFQQTGNAIASILLGLTLAMAAIPEEIPVAFSSFMVLGAYQMTKLGIITRRPQSIENLGAVSVICLDKTGTVTENKMQVKSVYSYADDRWAGPDEMGNGKCREVLYYARLASEARPFDAMEKGIAAAFDGLESHPPMLEMIHEYPLEGRPPMMTHVYREKDRNLVAGKGGAERILKICHLDEQQTIHMLELVRSEAAKGYRLIAVARAAAPLQLLPERQDDFPWEFLGFVALYDPPKKNVTGVLQRFYAAGIQIKLLTGDLGETAITISNEVGLKHNNSFVTGDVVMKLSDEELAGCCRKFNVFARMFPDAKTRVIAALKASGAVVAMTGDGVNDGPAIKSADIGIALGMRGTEIARRAADLVLTDDNLGRIYEAVKQGRKVFANLKTAIRYIISIHIPIILTASLPIVLGWQVPTVFTPIHIIFLELIMGPTCSVFYEKEPATAGMMQAPPRARQSRLFHRGELLISITQGVVISAAVLGLYFFYMQQGYGLEKTRTMVFVCLLGANIFLTFVNRSFTETIAKTIRFRNPLVSLVLIASVLFMGSILMIAELRDLFGLTELTGLELFISLGIAFLSVFWFEGYKANLNQIG